MTDNICNCSTCENKRCVPNEVDYKNYRDDPNYMRCLIDKKIISTDEFCKICNVGCISHSQAREYLNAEVIAELERLMYRAEHDNNYPSKMAYKMAITLIRGKGGVK